MSESIGRHIGEIDVVKWLNAAGDFRPPAGKVVAIHAFQMLCPGCILHGVPQAQKVHAMFDEQHVSVLGLHTVFEHHDGMTEPSLKAFLHEFRVSFPVAIDRPVSGRAIPKTMELFQLQGTPSWLIFDRAGNLQVNAFGSVDDLALASEITRLALDGAPSGTRILKYNV